MENGNFWTSLKNGQNLIGAKNYDAAEDLLCSIISELEKEESNSERNSQLCEAYNNLGFIYYKKVEFNQAQSFYTKAIEMNKMFAPAYYNCGVIHYRLGTFESAVKALEKAVHLQPNNHEFQAGLHASRVGLLNQTS